MPERLTEAEVAAIRERWEATERRIVQREAAAKRTGAMGDQERIRRPEGHEDIPRLLATLEASKARVAALEADLKAEREQVDTELSHEQLEHIVTRDAYHEILAVIQQEIPGGMDDTDEEGACDAIRALRGAGDALALTLAAEVMPRYLEMFGAAGLADEDGGGSVVVPIAEESLAAWRALTLHSEGTAAPARGEEAIDEAEAVWDALTAAERREEASGG